MTIGIRGMNADSSKSSFSTEPGGQNNRDCCDCEYGQINKEHELEGQRWNDLTPWSVAMDTGTSGRKGRTEQAMDVCIAVVAVPMVKNVVVKNVEWKG
jgi:hypothetical protein